jgi:GAF domain-containing protein
LPIVSQTNSNLLAGIMVLGVNPRHALDDNYRIFFKLFAGNVASAMANATAREEERRRVEVRLTCPLNQPRTNRPRLFKCAFA